MRGKFGELLHELIRLRFGHQNVFAATCGRSEGWISRVVNGREDTLDFQSFEALIAPFTLVSDQERLHKAWVSDFARSPLDARAPSPSADTDEILAFCEQVPALVAACGTLPIFDAVKRLWLALTSDQHRFFAASAVGIVYIELASLIERRLEAIQVAKELTGRAIAANEPAIAAHSLWVGLAAHRGWTPVNSAPFKKARRHLVAYLNAWKARTTGDARIRLEMQHGVQRDLVLHSLDLAEADPAAIPLLDSDLNRLTACYDVMAEPSALTLCKEIEARVLIFGGKLDLAFEALSVARNGPTPNHPAHAVKTNLTTAALYRSLGQFDRAERKLLAAKAGSDQYGLLHYGTRAVSELKELARY